MREPLVQTQVLPYLRQLAKAGIRVHLLTFEPRLRTAWSREQLEGQRAQLSADGIEWFRLPYHKWPTLPATLFDILAGAWKTFRIARTHRIDVIHARGTLPTSMAMLTRRWTRCQLIFDVRGLNAEEYVDANLWTPDSVRFRVFKWVEWMSLRQASQVVVLTERMRDWLVSNRLKNAEQIEVIPCCVDFSRFDKAQQQQQQSAGGNRFEVIYAGSVTGLYLLEEMAQFFLAVRERQPDAFLRILTSAAPAEVAARLRQVGLSSDDFWVGKVSPADVPVYLRRARLGLSFRKPTFAQIASSPTKIAEYLAAGVPVVCNAEIGDVDTLLAREQVGVMLRSFDEASYATAAAEALRLAGETDIGARCIAAAHRNFDLTTVGGARYYNVYRRLSEQRMQASTAA
ncbi:MAG TPA: glycosyltransferase [Pyrinomonadaceae bacterium]|nr:glycosyltransferase [Pyrinomonadaceae bacterium]